MLPTFKHRLHVVGFPHTQTDGKHPTCAYTTKVQRWCNMMAVRGHTIHLYSGQHNTAACHEHIPVVTDEQQLQWFGPHRWNEFYPIEWEYDKPYWQTFIGAAGVAISSRLRSGDIVLVNDGSCLGRGLRELLPQVPICEMGIGYLGTSCKYRCFESHAHRHYVHGRDGENDGRFLDTVIPSYFDPKDFPFRRAPDDYYLFVGRLVRRKGPRIAVDTTSAIKERLLMVGPGVIDQGEGFVKAQELTLLGSHFEHLGTVDERERGILMAGAKALFAPTLYCEPFGNVVVEAQLCGTPTITTDFGAFPETNIDGVTGFRCHTYEEFVRAALYAPKLDRNTIRITAERRYSYEAVAPQYEEWLNRIPID